MRIFHGHYVLSLNTNLLHLRFKYKYMMTCKMYFLFIERVLCNNSHTIRILFIKVFICGSVMLTDAKAGETPV